jgi:hypothetical protein
MRQRPNIVRHRGAGRHRGTMAWWLLPITASLACAGLLGIEDAQCDSGFDPECSSVPSSSTGGTPGGGAGSGGMGGGGSGGAGGSGIISAGGGGSGGLGTLGGTGGGLPALTLCEEYCDVVEANCIEADQQYASRTSCLEVCDLLEPGAEGTVTGNTVRCRLDRVRTGVLTGEPERYCFSAGPGGAGECGEDCDGYCTLMLATCPDDFNTREQCLSACASVPDLSEPPDTVKFNTSFTAGDSLQCRLFHVSAATIDPLFHCEHAAGLSICAP